MLDSRHDSAPASIVANTRHCPTNSRSYTATPARRCPAVGSALHTTCATGTSYDHDAAADYADW